MPHLFYRAGSLSAFEIKQPRSSSCKTAPQPFNAGSRRCFHIGLAKLTQGMPLRRGTPPEQVLCVQGLKARFGELAAALGGVDLHARQLIEPQNRQDYRLAVPVGRQQVAGVVRFSLAGDMNGVPPIAGAGASKCVKIFCGSSHSVLHFLKLKIR